MKREEKERPKEAVGEGRRGERCGWPLLGSKGGEEKDGRWKE